MTRNERRVRDRYTFSLTGIPVVSSYASMPVILNDRIRKVRKATAEGDCCRAYAVESPASRSPG